MSVEITMKIAKFHMDLMFGVLPVNGNPAAPISKCCRTNIFNNLNIEDNHFAQKQAVLSGNAVGKTMGMSFPITAASRVAQLKDIMTKAFDETYEIMQQKNIDMRTAAYVKALNTLGEALSAQGTQSHFTNGEN